VGTEPLDLAINGTHFRVVCDDPDSASLLRAALSNHLIDDPAPLGFYVESTKKKLHIVLDRSGFVLGRTRTPEHALSVLAGHLAAFLPPPEGTVRLRMRALVDRDHRAVLAVPPLMMLPPLVERRLKSIGHRLLDRLAVDIDRDGQLHLPASTWPELLEFDDGPGHVSALSEPVSVAAVMLPSANPKKPPSVAQVVHAVASNSAGPDALGACLDAAEVLAATKIMPIDLDTPDGLYLALRR
jgi:hypothetical protein